MNNVQQQLKVFIASEFAYDQGMLNEHDDLLNQGVIDSMGVLQIVTYMEKTFGIQITDEEITPENFRSLNALANLVVHKNGTHGT
ncbi:acyl carrier protein [bacterium]|nr:acyl carrier protein [bacterium]